MKVVGLRKGPQHFPAAAGLRASGGSGLLGTRAIQCLQSRSVRADQRQVERGRVIKGDIGRIFLAPAQLEEITGFLDRDGSPRPPHWLSSLANTR